ncbi:class I SAM-dependent methyltransferase [bacterium]|nr:class I SAM-dependent methyltransferase [bacterium]
MKNKSTKLDIGCGKNKREGFIGIDIDPNSDADIIASALNLPFKDNSVDEIYSSHLVEHFSPKETEKFFAEIYRVLKKNSRAFLKIDTDWTKKRLLQKDPTHKHRYSVREIKKILRQFNFSQSKVKRKIYLINFHLRNKIFVELVK